MRGYCEGRFRYSPEDGGLANCRPLFSIILRPVTMKSWRFCIWMMGSSPKRETVITRRFLRGRIILTRFIGGGWGEMQLGTTPRRGRHRRGLAEIELGDYAAAVPDLERTLKFDRNYDFQRAKGLLAWAYAQTEQKD